MKQMIDQAIIRFDNVPQGVESKMLKRVELPVHGDILEYEYIPRKGMSLDRFEMALQNDLNGPLGKELSDVGRTGALGGFATGVTSEMSSDNCFDWGNVGSATVGGAVCGAICGAIGGAAGDALSDAANFGAESLLSGEVSLWAELGTAYSQMLDETFGKSK